MGCSTIRISSLLLVCILLFIGCSSNNPSAAPNSGGATLSPANTAATNSSRSGQLQGLCAVQRSGRRKDHGPAHEAQAWSRRHRLHV